MTGVPFIRALILSKIFFFFRFTVSTKLMMSQYICLPSPFRNPPAIFSRFLQILRSFSDILLLKGTLIETVAKDILDSLKQFFPIDYASQIFVYASILFANDFVHVDQVQNYYEQSWLAQEYKTFSFHMGRTALGTLLDHLGRRTQRASNYEIAAVKKSSSAIAIDGHAIRSCSEENDLGESGYKFHLLKEDQVNLLMGYDVNTGLPLFARMYRGVCNDKSTIEDLTDLIKFSGILFVIDRGFYSAKNLEILASNDNTYIIPVPAHINVYKEVMRSLKYTDSFYYRSGKKHARIEYMLKRISETDYIYVFRDIDENEKVGSIISIA